MAVFHFNDATLSVGGTDLSDHVAALTLEASADALDDTAMGDDYRSRIGGLKDTQWTVTFHQDFAASKTDATIWANYGSTATIVAKPTSDAVSTTNPSYTQTVLINDYKPIGGAVGDLAQVSVTWPGAGALAKATS